MPDIDQFLSGADEIDAEKDSRPNPEPTQRVQYDPVEQNIKPAVPEQDAFAEDEDTSGDSAIPGGIGDFINKDQGTFGNHLKDLGLALPRLAEENIRDVGSLVGLVDEDTPRVFGKPKTTAGQIGGALANYASFFVGFGKFVKGAGFLWKGAKAVEGLDKGSNAVKAIQASSKLKGLTKIVSSKAVREFGTFIGVGAAADFVALNPEDGRLADFTNTIPGLKALTPDYLVSKEGDSAIESRLKNVLEGAGIGAAFGAVSKAFKSAKVLRGLKKANASPEAIEKASKQLGKNIDAIDDVVAKKITKAEGTVTIPKSLRSTDLDAEAIGKEILDYKQGQDLPDSVIRNSINLDKLDGPKEVVDTIEHLAKKVKGTNVLKNKDLMDQALKDMGKGTTADEITELIALNVQDAATVNESILRSTISREIHMASTEALWKTADEALTNPEAYVKWIKALKTNMAILESGEELASSYARGLQSRKALIKMKPNFTMEQVSELLTKPKQGRKFIKDFKSGGNLKTGAEYLRGANTSLFQDIVSFRAIAMLAALPGRVLDAGMTGWRVFTLPVRDTFVDLALGKGLKSFRQLTKYRTYMETMADSAKIALRAYKKGHSIITMNASDAEDVIRLMGKVKQKDSGIVATGRIMVRAATKGLGYIGARAALATDELFKQITAKAYAKLALSDEALELGLKGVARTGYVNKGMAQIFRKGGRALREGDTVLDAYRNQLAQNVKPKDALKAAGKVAKDLENVKMVGISDEALKHAKNATFQDDLVGITKKYDRLANEYALLQYFTTFRRTAVNLFNLAASPLLGTRNLARSFKAEIVAKDPNIRRRAVEQLVEGMMIYGTAIGLIATGRFTGGGPVDRAEMDALLATGWRPYSVKIDGTYYSYHRMEPFASVLGFMIDINDRFDEFNYHDFKNDPTEVLGSYFLTLKRNLLNKTYTKGLSDAFNLMTDLDENGQQIKQFLKSGTSSFIPGIVGHTASATNDEYAREIRDVLDAPINKLPTRGKLPYKRNLLGEKVRHYTADEGDMERFISPFMRSHETNDAVFLELVNIKAGFESPSKSRGGVDDLTKVLDEDGNTAYDIFQENIGLVKISGKNIRQALEAKIKTASYQKLDPTTTKNIESARVAVLRATINQYRAKAFKQTIKEIPALKDLVKDRKIITRGQRRGEKLDRLLEIVNRDKNNEQ